MATPRWKGKALPVAQVNTIVVALTWAAGDTATLTINGRDLVLTVGATVTTTAIATAIKEMVNGDDITGDATRSETGDNVPEFDEITATVNSSTVTLTGDTKGKPFTLTVTEVTAGTGTATGAVATAATGPNHWDNTDNWDTGALPADGDTVYIDHSDVSIWYGLAQSAIEPAAMYVGLSFTGEIGLPEVNEDGGYPEYRDQYLQIGPVILRIGDGVGNGSGRIKIDCTSDVCALTVVATGNSLDEQPALIWKGTNAANALVMRAGSVGVAIFGGETATLATFRIDGGTIEFGAGVTLSGALQLNDGSAEINSLIDTSLTMLGGTVVIDGTGNVDQLTIRGGTCVYKTTGTLGGATIVSGTGILDFEQDPSAKTVTNPIDVYGEQAQVFDVDKVVASLIVDLNEGARPEQVRWGTNVRLTRGTPA